MIIKNFNLADDLIDKNIYRIIPFDRFMQMLEYGKNIFVRPHLWEDPFENLLTFPSPTKKTNQHEYEKYYVYAQCWSFSGENDLLWRAYSPNSDSVRIKSTPRKLIDSIHNSDKIFKIENSPKSIYYDEDIQIDEEINGFIGEVRYLPYEQISSYLNERVTKDDLDSYFETLLIKREAFKNEEELRLGVRYYFDFEDIFLELSNDIFEYDIKFNDLINEVVFDPRISDYKFKGLRKQIREYGFHNPVLKSNLYDLPKIDQLLK